MLRKGSLSPRRGGPEYGGECRRRGRGPGSESSGTNLAVVPSPVAATTVPAKLDVPLPVPHRVIEAKVESPGPSPTRTKDGYDVFWMASVGGWAKRGTGVSSASFWGRGEKLNWTSPSSGCRWGSDGRADEHGWTISIDADAQKKAEASPSDTEKR